MAVYKNTQGERYTLATFHLDLLDAQQRTAELEKTDDTVISLSCYWEDINRRWSIHHRELTTLIREIYEAGQWTRRFVSSLSA